MIPTGWNPGRHGSESELAAAQRLMQEYPDTTAIRKFFDGPLGAPDEGALGVAPVGSRVVVSWVHSATMPQVGSFVTALLQRGLMVDLCVAHEPEKKITPQQLLDANRALDSQIPHTLDARRTGQVRLAACMTVQRARVYNPADLRRFVTPDLAEVIDVLAWDWYPSYAPKGEIDHYESPAEAFDLVESFSTEMELPWAVYEFNHSRILEANGFAVNLDTTGQQCADWMGDAYNWAVENGCTTWCHFHKGGGSLTDPAAPRHPEYAALKDMMRSSFEPDPNHPQYLAGYQVGVDSGKVRAYDAMQDWLDNQRG